MSSLLLIHRPLTLLLGILGFGLQPVCMAQNEEYTSIEATKSDTLAADSLTAWDRLAGKVKHTTNIIYRFVRHFNDYDPTYIAPNYYNFTTMAQSTNHFQVYRLEGGDRSGRHQSITTQPQPGTKVGPYLGWQWLFIGYAFDVSSPHKGGKHTEFTLSLYSAMLGCDFVHLRNNGDYRLRRATGFVGVPSTSVKDMHFNGMGSTTTSLSAYYVFNHKRFSYPAAYNQSTVQLKSAGSPMLGLGFSKQKVDFDHTRLPTELLYTPTGESALVDELKFKRIDYTYYYLSGGYAYNWVFAPRWLLGASIMPSIGWRKAKGSKIEANNVWMNIKNFSFDCLSRLGLVWNNSRCFAGASFISHLYIYRKDRLSVTNSINYLNVYVGFYFDRKSKYKDVRL